MTAHYRNVIFPYAHLKHALLLTLLIIITYLTYIKDCNVILLYIGEYQFLKVGQLKIVPNHVS